MKIISRSLFDDLAVKAAASPRLRTHFTLHESDADPVQRFFVVASRRSYFRPHRHLTRSELALVVRGRFDVVTFDDGGRVLARYGLGDGTDNIAYETPQGVWHTVVAVADGSAFLEVKEGPYDRATAVEFAPWAPAEGDALAGDYLEWARTAAVGAYWPIGNRA